MFQLLHLVSQICRRSWLSQELDRQHLHLEYIRSRSDSFSRSGCRSRSRITIHQHESNAPRPMWQVSSSYSLLLPCHLLACCILSCHHVHCIIMFSKFASVPASSFSPLSVLSPDTLARTRGMSEIVFYKWPENVLGMG